MHTTTNQPGGSVLASLRALAPSHPITLDEALRLAERQATRLLELCGGATVPVSTRIVSEQPRITVEPDPELPAHAASGCSDWDSRRRSWVISLNPTESRRRRRFTVLHEYKHILDHPCPGIRPGRYTYLRPAAEIVADYFAGCVLIPKRLLATAYYDGIQSLRDLAQLFDVSQEAVAVRLLQIGLGEAPQFTRPTRPATRSIRRAQYHRATKPEYQQLGAA